MSASSFVAVLCRASGLLALWRWWHRNSIIILTVHGVSEGTPNAEWTPLRTPLAPARLDWSLGLLASAYRFVSMDEAVDMLSGKIPVQSRSIVLTFDDGYRNSLTEAVPILHRHGIRALVFVATGPVVSRRPFWFDRLDYAIQCAVRTPTTVTVGGRSIDLDPRSRRVLRDGYARIRAAAKAPLRDDREMNAELDALATQLEGAQGRGLADLLEGDPWAAVLTREEIRAAAADVDFGSHTVDHLRIHRLLPADAADQLRRSRQDLESWTARPCRHFCYPDGGVSDAAARLVGEEGFASAVTTARGLNRVGADLMQLKRIDVPASGTAAELLVEVSGLKDRLLGLRRRIFGGA